MLTFITKGDYSNVVWNAITITDDITPLFSFIESNSELCIDIETNSLDPLTAEIFLVSIGNEHQQFVIDATTIDISFLNNYKDILWVGHNIKYDYSVFKMNGIKLHKMYDTMITEQRLGMGSGRGNSLDVVIKRRLGIDLKMNKEETRTSFIGHSGQFTYNQIVYSGEDSEHLLKIKRIHEPLIEKYNMGFLLYDIEFPLISILGDCELRGLVLNREKWIEIIKEKEKEQINLRNELYETLRVLAENRGPEVSLRLAELFRPKVRLRSIGLWSQRVRINFNSHSQLKTIFEIFGEPIPVGTKKNADGDFESSDSVGIKTLQLYLKQNPQCSLKGFLETFIKYKKVQKHLSSFGYNFIDMISPVTGRLHTVYWQCFTDTGRLSSGDSGRTGKPNLQQIPKDKNLRRCFGYLPGYKILTIDLSSAELVILGSKAQDFNLIKLNEGDMHSYLATKSWRKILKDETYVVSQELNKDKRTEFKNVNYGILYGATARKIAETLNVDIQSAQTVVDVLREEIPNTFSYMDNISARGVADGFIVFNKRTNSRRWFIDRSRRAIGKIKRAAINSPIQGTQADMIKEAMVRLHKEVIKDRDIHLLMQVHDELVFAFKDDNFPEECKHILTDTANRYLEGVEMKASYIVRETWDKE